MSNLQELHAQPPDAADNEREMADGLAGASSALEGDESFASRAADVVSGAAYVPPEPDEAVLDAVV